MSRREFWKLLSEFLAQGITILMATPYLDEAERCSRVALLHEGELIALDTPANLRAACPGRSCEVIAERSRRVHTALLRALPGVTDVQLFGERVHVRLEPARRLPTRQRLRRRCGRPDSRPRACRRVPASLEDVFIAQSRRRKPHEALTARVLSAAWPVPVSAHAQTALRSV